MRGVRSGDKGRGRDGEELANFEPGSDLVARATVLAEGTWGHLTGAAIGALRPRRRPAGVGAGRQGGLGGRRAAGPRHPHPRLAAADRREVARVRRLVDLPDEPRGRAAARVDRLRRGAEPPRRDPLGPRRPAAVQDAPARSGRSWRAASASRGARRRSPRAAAGRCRACTRRAWSIAGDAAGMVNVPELKGVHYAMHAGILAAEQIVARAARRARRTCRATTPPCAGRSSGATCAARGT